MRLPRVLMTLLLAAAALYLLQPVLSARSADDAPPVLTPELARKLHPTLLKQLLTTPAAEYRVQIVLRDQLNLGTHRTRAALVADLQTLATRSQAGVRAVLDRAQATARAADIRPLWINNSIAARLDRALVLELAARADVALIKLDEYRRWIDPAWRVTRTPDAPLPASIEWGVARIRADEVWSALNITGTGVVVASMDSGVDGQHPALLTAYRGYNPKGLPLHLGNWFDATSLPSQYPYDAFGHGTHTIGTVVAGDGVGVAPGATWIAVRIFDGSGSGYDSWIHAGFQWLLAPGGNPDRAPDIVNNSWGTPLGMITEFQPDVQALNAAGQIVVFAAGNTGPNPGSVYAPASYPEAFSVGATDDEDVITLFSSRGPSPLGPLKPEVMAPGVNVKSTYPGGGYAYADGTSMATPHVAGIMALMKAAAPALTWAQARDALTLTARHVITDVYPNNLYGYGRVDAYDAVWSVAQVGSISGLLTREDGSPVAQARIEAEAYNGGRAQATSNAAGQYQLFAGAGAYTVTIHAFGYLPQTRPNVPVIHNAVTKLNAKLTPLPTALVTGRVTNLTGTQSLSGTLVVQGEPVSIHFDGAYALPLPIGTHVLEARVPGYRQLTATVTILAGHNQARDFALPAAPAILLVDSGRWYQRSQINYYREALTDLGYPYTDWVIRDVNADVPTTPTLHLYDVIIWSSPLDAPGYIGAGPELDDYLQGRGRVFLSGQDVAYFDSYWREPYLIDRLYADLVTDNAATRSLWGQGLFAGQAISIAGSGGADNQLTPDEIKTVNPAFTSPAFEYAPGRSGGQTTDACYAARGVYLSYGFEAITERAARQTIMERSLDFLTRPPQPNRYAFGAIAGPVISPPGTVVTRSLILYNQDETVISRTFALTAQSAWPINLSLSATTLYSCTQQMITISVTVPPNLPPQSSELVTVTANPIGGGGPTITTTLTVQTPSPVLLVQDDPWYGSVEAPAYTSALTANGLSYDLYVVPSSWSGPEPPVPTLETLRGYPLVVWFNGYDPFAAMSDDTARLLRAYVGEGGGLVLSGQDFLPYYSETQFARDVLGVLEHTYYTASHVSGLVGGVYDGLSELPINLPYVNYSRGVVPAADADLMWVGQHAWPTALGYGYGDGRSLYMAVGFEGLPPAQRAAALNRAVGYVSRLGRSGAEFDRALAEIGERVTVIITTANDRPSPIGPAAFTVTVPASLALASGALTWQGTLPPQSVLTRTLDFTVTAGGLITVPVEWYDDQLRVGFTKHARLDVQRPYLALSIEPHTTLARPLDTVTWTVTISNVGAQAAQPRVVANLPYGTLAISGTERALTGTTTFLTTSVEWAGAVPAGQAVTMTYEMSYTWIWFWSEQYYASATAAFDGQTWYADHWIDVVPYQAYLPIMPKQ